MCAQHRWRFLLKAGYAVQPSQTMAPSKSSLKTSSGTALPRLSWTAYSVYWSVRNVLFQTCSPSSLWLVSSTGRHLLAESETDPLVLAATGARSALGCAPYGRGREFLDVLSGEDISFEAQIVASSSSTRIRSKHLIIGKISFQQTCE